MSRLRVVRDAPGGRPYGLPAPLPEGETIVWQGAPNWRVLARRVLHVRKIAIYFALLTVWCGGSALLSGSPRLWYSATALIILGMISTGLLSVFAWLVARTSVYTLTERRVVLRIGVAMSMSLNLPFCMIDSAAVRLHRDGSGDIPLLLNGPTRMGMAMLWPHVRPWRTRRVQPMMRAVPDAARVARLLAETLAASTGQQAPAAATVAVAAQPQTLRAGQPASMEA